jgi:Ca-activated chloride channel family protein
MVAAVAAGGQQPHFRSGVDLVRVDVLVTEGGKPVRGLTRSDFELRDNGQLQDVDAVYGEDQPLDVVLLLDVSGSLQGMALDSLKRAALGAVDGLRADDRVRLLAFSHRISMADARAGDTEAVRSAILRLDAGGSTALCDALYTSLAMTLGSPRRTVALLFSDGRDNRSWLSAQAVTQVARESDVVVYAIAFKPPWRSSEVAAPAVASEPNRAFLETLSGSTGGRLVWEQESRRLPTLFKDLLEEMRGRYVLAYYPQHAGGPGWHKIAVQLKTRQGKVLARAGYTVR